MQKKKSNVRKKETNKEINAASIDYASCNSDIVTESRVTSGKCFKNIKLAGHALTVLIDTGSDLSLVRESTYVLIGASVLCGEIIEFREFGSIVIKPLVNLQGHFYRR